jgi:Fic family protein
MQRSLRERTSRLPRHRRGREPICLNPTFDDANLGRFASYYDVNVLRLDCESLEGTQKGDLDITARLLWFIETFSKTLAAAEETFSGILRKADFWQRYALTPLNERQRKVLNRFLDGFDGKLTARKWSSIAKCSMPTAQRDIKELVDKGMLIRNEGGSKNTSYAIAGP